MINILFIILVTFFPLFMHIGNPLEVTDQSIIDRSNEINFETENPSTATDQPTREEIIERLNERLTEREKPPIPAEESPTDLITEKILSNPQFFKEATEQGTTEGSILKYFPLEVTEKGVTEQPRTKKEEITETLKETLSFLENPPGANEQPTTEEIAENPEDSLFYKFLPLGNNQEQPTIPKLRKILTERVIEILEDQASLETLEDFLEKKIMTESEERVLEIENMKASLFKLQASLWELQYFLDMSLMSIDPDNPLKETDEQIMEKLTTEYEEIKKIVNERVLEVVNLVVIPREPWATEETNIGLLASLGLNFFSLSFIILGIFFISIYLYRYYEDYLIESFDNIYEGLLLFLN